MVVLLKSPQLPILDIGVPLLVVASVVVVVDRIGMLSEMF